MQKSIATNEEQGVVYNHEEGGHELWQKVKQTKKEKLKHPIMHGFFIFSVVLNNAQANYHQISNLWIR